MQIQELLPTLRTALLQPLVFEEVSLAPERAEHAIATCLGSWNPEITARASLTELITAAVSKSPLLHSSLHGWKHWMSVYRNAVTIAHFAGLHKFDPPDIKEGEASPELDFTAVAMMFALFHDCRRDDEGWDIAHGAIGAAALAAFIGEGGMTYEDTAALFACNTHTVVEYPRAYGPLAKFNDYDSALLPGLNEQVRAAVGMCLDADRLDLTRLGYTPDPNRLYHSEASIQAHQYLYERGAWAE